MIFYNPYEIFDVVVVVVYRSSISIVKAPWILKLFCIAGFTLCKNVGNTPAASLNLSDYYLTLSWIHNNNLYIPFFVIFSKCLP